MTLKAEGWGGWMGAAAAPAATGRGAAALIVVAMCAGIKGRGAMEGREVGREGGCC